MIIIIGGQERKSSRRKTSKSRSPTTKRLDRLHLQGHRPSLITSPAPFQHPPPRPPVRPLCGTLSGPHSPISGPHSVRPKSRMQKSQSSSQALQNTQSSPRHRAPTQLDDQFVWMSQPILQTGSTGPTKNQTIHLCIPVQHGINLFFFGLCLVATQGFVLWGIHVQHLWFSSTQERPMTIQVSDSHVGFPSCKQVADLSRFKTRSHAAIHINHTDTHNPATGSHAL